MSLPAHTNAKFSNSELCALLAAISACGFEMADYDLKIAKTEVGVVREAFVTLRNHALWKIQVKAGQLHYYLCGTEALNPFVPVMPE